MEDPSGEFERATSGEPPDPVELQETAAKMGFEYRDCPRDDLLALVELVVESDNVSDVMQRQVRGGSFYLCNHEKRKRHGVKKRSRDSPEFLRRWTEICRLTLLVFQADDVCFPPMHVTPPWGQQRRPMQWFGRSQYDRLKFEDDPEFHRNFDVGTVVPEAVEPILSAQVRKTLKGNGSLTIVVSGRVVIVFDDSQRSYADVKDGGTCITSHWLKPHEWPSFARDGIQVISALRKAEEKTRDQRPSAAEVTRRVSEQRDGPELGSVLATELDLFLELPLPRAVPKAVAEASRSNIEPWRRLVGLILCLIPSGLLVLTWGMIENTYYRILLALVLSLFSLTGAGLLYHSVRRRWRTVALLKRGRVTSARIADVKRTSTVITVDDVEYRRYRVVFKYSVYSDEYQGTVYTYGDQTRRALRIREAGEQTRLLVNETAPQDIFWIDGLRAE